MTFTIETEQENDRRWIAEILELAGVLAYGRTQEEAVARAKALALHVLADAKENWDAPHGFN
ncbi:type II toxin-antitoxin system HicB family antitoxin [Candidatus Oscillochloris fontis]|uniref:type II toxin-antitoxin system HicB family antitoxin n=1 Tax=Candidatus Oscillochloris fontis TaxID=2496868 RepID=UPI00101BD52F|nr:type II toxin-antitoxin system HicB family antitoxin [Candidatus Oscillochloris fontis]